MDPDKNRDLKDRIDALREEGVLAVTCPTCGAEASFHRAFAWLTGEEAERAKADPEILGVAESDGVIVELFPEVFLWSDPERVEAGRMTGNRVGVLHCDACGHHDKHRLAWPQDLYYYLKVNDKELLAYTRQHAEDNLQLLLQIQALPAPLRAFLKSEVGLKLPPAFVEAAYLGPAIAALLDALGVSSEDD